MITDLLNNVVEAHGGLNRWNELETVSACLIPSGVLRVVKVSRACSTTFSSRQACVRSGSRTIRSALPTGEACLPPERVAIEAFTEPLLVSIDLSEITFV